MFLVRMRACLIMQPHDIAGKDHIHKKEMVMAKSISMNCFPEMVDRQHESTLV